MCIYLNFHKSKECATMVPTVYCHVVARKSYTAGFFSTASNRIQRCRKHSNGEKGFDLSDLWRSRNSAITQQKSAPQPQRSSSAVSYGFRPWRRSAASRTAVASDNEIQPSKNHRDDDMSLLKFLAINALDLTAPASDILLKSRNDHHWFQLSGHPDSLAPAGPGTVWKKRAGGVDNTERTVYEALSADPLMRDCVPRYFREVDYQGEKFIELQDLLYGFKDPNVMDIKMGTRTFLESEVQKSNARPDLYKKMIAVDPTAPTEEEHLEKAVTKLRYMQFREQQSSTCSMGFRIEAIKNRGSPPVTDLKKVKSEKEVLVTMTKFLAGREDVRQKILKRLKEIRTRFEQSEYFRTHEVIGSSIFMLYDDTNVGVWIIDFAKTNKVPEGMCLDHRKSWMQGNHEEGFLFGLDRLISVLEEVQINPYHSPFENCNNALPVLNSSEPIKS